MLLLALKNLSVDVAPIVDEAGSDENLRSALLDLLVEGGLDHVPEMAKLSCAKDILEKANMPVPPDVCIIFAMPAAMGLVRYLCAYLPPKCVVFGAVSGAGIIGTTADKGVRELPDGLLGADNRELLSITLMRMPATRIYPFFEVWQGNAGVH